MAAKKKVEAVYKIDEANKQVIMQEKDIINLTESDNAKIGFYVNTLKFTMCFVEPEEKVRKSFTIAKAITYITKHDKDSLKEFEALKKDANKLAEEYKKVSAAAAAAKEADATEEVKKAAPSTDDIKAARKAMITEQRKAFAAQKELFKKKYGVEAYEEVKAAKK